MKVDLPSDGTCSCPPGCVRFCHSVCVCDHYIMASQRLAGTTYNHVTSCWRLGRTAGQSPWRLSLWDVFPSCCVRLNPSAQSVVKEKEWFLIQFFILESIKILKSSIRFVLETRAFSLMCGLFRIVPTLQPLASPPPPPFSLHPTKAALSSFALTSPESSSACTG